MTDAEMLALRAAAEKATPGVWGIAINRDGSVNIVTMPNAEHETHKIALVNKPAYPNAAYIALANPAAVLALLDRVAAAEARLDAAWRAGRDAAVALCEGIDKSRRFSHPDMRTCEAEECGERIRELQPPADLAAAAATCDAVAAARREEREACAKLCDNIAEAVREHSPDNHTAEGAAFDAAAAIRARKDVIDAG